MKTRDIGIFTRTERTGFRESVATVLLLAVIGLAHGAEAQDVVQIDSVVDATAGSLVVVPIKIRDRPGTALDSSAVASRRLHTFSLTLEVSPAGAVSSVEIVRAGLTAGLLPRFETQFAADPRRSWIVSFDEPVVFAGGAQTVAQLRLLVAPGAPPGTTISLELIAETTALANAAGTLVETEGNGGLTLVDGTVVIGGQGCTTATSLCLLDDRFHVEIDWRDFVGQTGFGTAVPLTNETGYFWFFDSGNVEAVVKVLDGRAINGSFWVFYGGLSNVEYTITVTDSVTDRVKQYFNPSGGFASVGDTQAFPDDGEGSSAVSASSIASAGVIELSLDHSPDFGTSKQGACAPTSTRLCSLDDRFALEMSWEDFVGQTGVGKAVTLTDETGYFWFFNQDNVELVVKVLDGRAINGRFWVFYGALSNVRFTLEVTDTETGDSRVYENPAGTFASVGDTAAF